MSGPMDIREFVEYHDIEIDSIEWIGGGRWHAGDNSWKVRLRRPDEDAKRGYVTMTVPQFTTGSALDFGEGDIDDAVMILGSLQSDAQTAEYMGSPEELAEEYGMDWFERDERLRAINIFRGVNSEKKKLEKFLGDLYEEFLELEE